MTLYSIAAGSAPAAAVRVPCRTSGRPSIAEQTRPTTVAATREVPRPTIVRASKRETFASDAIGIPPSRTLTIDQQTSTARAFAQRQEVGPPPGELVTGRAGQR